MTCLPIYQNSYNPSPDWRWWAAYTSKLTHQFQPMRENHDIFKTLFSKLS